jgi:signal peptidase I
VSVGKVVVAVGLAVAALAAWALLAPPQVGGSTTYVTTHGISMEPGFHTGDLAVMRSTDHYRVGDVVAYRSQMLDTVVMHRIVKEQAGRFTFKGDNNAWLDPETPTQDALLGRLVLRSPTGEPCSTS